MYDLKYALSFKANQIEGFIGVIFRKKDDFNYYSLDINKDWVRFRKMINGQQSIISKSDLTEKIHMNAWYNVEMVAK